MRAEQEVTIESLCFCRGSMTLGAHPGSAQRFLVLNIQGE
jgi:hypothetical protein